jgi:uncharacterized membrane protein YjjB (DUF3815 family)
MPISLVLRYRAGTARRQARGWVTMINLAGLSVSTALFLMGAGLTSIWVPHAFGYSVLGLLGGVALGIIGLWMSRWERAPGTLHYTPNRWLVLAVTLIVTGRFAYGLWRGFDRWHHAGGETSFLAAFGVAGSLAAGAVVLGYYLSYWLGLRRRLQAHGRA